MNFSPKKKPRIVFMGTPVLAAAILDATVIRGYNVVAVVTAPDRPAGRGRKIQQPPVKIYAKQKGIDVLQPENLKDPEFSEQLKALEPDIQVVVAFRMLPRSVWSLPKTATFNLHASLLPDYRGAAPINWAIINGEKVTGVTTFLIDDKIDTGKILLQRRIPLDKYETAGSLGQKVIREGAVLVPETIDGLFHDNIRPVPQAKVLKEGAKLNRAPKIYTEDRKIDWTLPCERTVNLIHGLSPSPGAFCEIEPDGLQKTIMKIYEARPVKTTHNFPPGKVITDNKSYLDFATPDGFVRILQLQLSGKKRMSVEELLRGLHIDPPKGQ